MDKVLNFIKYLEDENEVFYTVEQGYLNYSSKFQEFIDSCYESNYIRKNYLDFLNDRYLGIRDINSIILTGDYESLCALLTYLIRQERFCDGLWATAIIEKSFFNILIKLKQYQEVL